MTLTSTGNAQGYAVWRHDDAVLRGAVGAEDDGARVVIHIQSLSLEALSRSFLKPNYIPHELAALRNAVGGSQETELGRI